jgi:hypothetical protein
LSGTAEQYGIQAQFAESKRENRKVRNGIRSRQFFLYVPNTTYMDFLTL